MSKAKFYKTLVWVNGAIPGLMLAWDAYYGRLGANAVNDALRTTGLLALIFFMLSLLVTPLRRVTKWNELVAVRRPLGLWGFYYVCIHLAIYVGLDRALNLTSTVEEILSRRYLQVGFFAVLLLTPLAITSSDSMVRRLGGKRWKLLHRLAYLAIALGVLHYYLLVKSDVRQPLAFAGLLGLLLGSRFVWHYRDLRQAAQQKPKSVTSRAPLKRSFWKGELRVARIFSETSEVRTFRLVAVHGGPLPFDHQPGQYLTLEQQIEGRRVIRCYTIASAPSRSRYCEISVKREPLGTSSRHLHDHVREGDRLKVSAPAGHFVFDGKGSDRVVLIAGGVGITPLMSMARYLTDSCWPGRIDFLIAARTPDGIIFHEELKHLSARLPNLHVHIILSAAEGDPTWSGACGRLTREVLEKWVDDWQTPLVHLCGPKPMMTGVTELLVSMGVAAERIKTEAFVSPAIDPPLTDGDVSAKLDGDLTMIAEDAGIHFARSSKSGRITKNVTVLEAAEEIGVNLPFECRSGVCGQCKTKLNGGRVLMNAEDALLDSEKQAGYILACQAHALEDLSVEA